MNVRFAEPCRDNPLELVSAELPVQAASINDGRTQKELHLECKQDIYIGVFFDGTNNNKYRDTPGFSHSNVARLYEVYPGTPAGQTEPTLPPKILANGKPETREVFKDKAFNAASVPENEYPYYRKIYVPGVGTPMPDVGDSGTGMQKTLGLSMALLGQIRLDWAMVQLCNQVHAAVFKTPIDPIVNMARLLTRNMSLPDWAVFNPAFALLMGQVLVGEELKKQWDKLIRDMGVYNQKAFKEVLDGYDNRLQKAIKQRGANKPHLRKIRLSVFGFSRGAAQARSWVNMVNQRWGSALAGIELQVDFLGLFDTVASVGIAQVVPKANGHFAWADSENMMIPPHIKRCVHLVAGFEVRGSFPLDSVCMGNDLPSNCKEIVYPGVHSDVGGGYPPDDQGRALGKGAAGDKLKLSQIALAQMYREARMAGAPLAPESAMIDSQKINFAIAPELREDFNAYVAATRSGSVPPTQGQGDPQFARMFPTETQPRDLLTRIMRRHYAYFLQWRKALLNRPGGVAGLPCLQKASSDTKYQDITDFRDAEDELRKELAFLQNKDPNKFTQYDDQLLNYINTANKVVSGGTRQPVSLAAILTVGMTGSIESVIRQKQEQWDNWLKDDWEGSPGYSLTQANAEKTWVLFETYLHDSRAWFKPFMRANTFGLIPDDEEWFTFGKRDKECQARTKELTASIDKYKKSGARAEQAAAEKELDLLKTQGPVMRGGREPYVMWGYLKHRRVYQSGKLIDSKHAWHQKNITQEEDERLRKQRHDNLVVQENARHDAEVKRIKERSNAVIREHRLSPEDEREYLRTARHQLDAENQYHAEQLGRIESQTKRTKAPA